LEKKDCLLNHSDILAFYKRLARSETNYKNNFFSIKKYLFFFFFVLATKSDRLGQTGSRTLVSHSQSEMSFPIEAMPAFAVMQRALDFLKDMGGLPIVIKEDEYSSMPSQAVVCGQLLQLKKIKDECNLSVDKGQLFDNGILVGSGEEGMSAEEFAEHIKAIQMWYLNPWRSLAYFIHCTKPSPEPCARSS
jgi:hypothetical protein